MPKGLKRALSALLIALFLYSLIGFLILPGVALRIANQQLAQYATLPASLHRLQLNPFSLELSLWGLRIGETGQEQLSFQRLYANLQLDSLWGGVLHLAEVELEGAHTRVLFAEDGTLNLSQLFKLPDAPPQSAEQSPGDPFPLRIERIRLNGNALHFQDLRPSEPVEFAYDSLSLELHNLSTLPGDNAEMTLTATGPHGGRIDWQGRIGFAPLTSSGSLKLSDGRLRAIWPYVRDALPLALQEGQIDFSSNYRLDLSDGTELQLSQLTIQLAPFAIDSPEGKPLLRLQRLDVADTSLDLAKQQVVVGQVRSQGLEAWAAREADGELDWQKLFAGKPTAASEPASAEEASKPWQVLLRDVQLRDYQAHLLDRVPEQQVALEVGPLNLELNDFDSLGDKPFGLKLDTALGKQGKLQASGQVQLQPTSAQLKVATQDIDLRLAQAYLSPFIRLELRSGLLASELEVQLSGTEPLALQVTGNARLDQLHTLDTLRERDFLRWHQVRVDGLDYRHGERLAIERVELDQPYARVVINEDLTTNLSELIVAQPAETNTEQAAGKPLAVRIGGVTITDGSANFADFSLTPNFATAIQQLNGRIGTLDNQSPQAASVDIQGKVDRYAPVSVKGKLTPFDPLNSLDIATSFNNVELTTITPYSGKFAGYRIRKGRLNLDLHYRIEQGQLNAENKVLVENLQLGEKVDSPDAVDLPIRLAVALLKDPEGKIAIELPVKGDLNNPEFSVMPIVWQTLRNLVLRAAQAPFKFVAGLVAGGSDVDLSTVPFDAGSHALSDDARQALDTLAKALQERPALRLEVEGQSAQRADGPLLAEQRLQREFREIWYRMLQRRSDKVPASADELVVDEDDQAILLEGIYRARLKQQPPAEWAELDDEQRHQRMRQAVLDSWAQSKLLLRQLAQQRAAAIKDYLVDEGGLPDERVYLIDVNLGEPEADGRVFSPLHLDSE